MFKVHVQGFSGNWNTNEFETKDEVFYFITTSDTTNRTEIEGVEFAGKIPTPDELDDWLRSDDEPVAERDELDDPIDEVGRIENEAQLKRDAADDELVAGHTGPLYALLLLALAILPALVIAL